MRRRSVRLQNRQPFDIERSRMPQLVSRPDVVREHHDSPPDVSDIPQDPTEQIAPDEDALQHLNSLSTTCIPYDPQTPLLGAARRLHSVNDVTQHYLGRYSFHCTFCSALHWQAEKTSHHETFLSCCRHGKVSLPFLQQPPQPLYDYLTSDSSEAKSFRQNIVQYNSALAFSSLGVSPDHSVNRQPGPPVFRVHGEVMHWSGTLLPDDNVPSYSQLYIFDAQQALTFRMTRNSNLHSPVMNSLQTMITIHNPYYNLYIHAYEKLQASSIPDYSARLVTLPGNDTRRNSLPTADEVAVILPDSSTHVLPTSRDILLTLRTSQSNHLQRISEGHAAYQPTHYVLLFPRGEAGWHWDLYQSQGARKLTLCQFISFRIHARPHNIEFSTILHGGRLLHHYLVDMYACVDQARLLYHRSHQQQYRVANACGMHDTLHLAENTAAEQQSLQERLSFLGQKIYLPSSYIGGPRDMYERYQDGMALARFFKQIDLFVTMTANPNWREVQEALLPGQSPYDRPDIIARVFHLKHQELLRAVKDDMIFGKSLAVVYTIEFQKRGLPHAHYLFTLASPYKLLTPDSIDSVVSASWPDPDNDPILFDVVKRHMVHGPCGYLNPHAPCMINGRCSKGFPKPFQERTVVEPHAYPRYERQDDGRSYAVGHHMVDNRWIVPYNPYLLKRYSAHINVECVINFGCMAYVMKYLKKLRDTGTLELRNRNDEIERYIQGRYFSAMEAAWHLFEFEIHGQKPSVIRLPIHLPNDQSIIYNPSESPEVLELRSQLQDSALMAFFRANADEGHLGTEARRYTYEEFPQHFVLKTERISVDAPIHKKKWELRQRGFAIGRIAFMKPSHGERYYLRLLLLQTRGPHSFESLREWPPGSGEIHATFHDTCVARGLLQDDNEWQLCLQEASEMQTGSQMRFLFVSLLLFSDISEPCKLWNEFKQPLCSDLDYRIQSLFSNHHPSSDEIFDFGLHIIDTSLQDAGHTLADYPSMPLSHLPWDLSISNPWVADQLAFDTELEHSAAEQKLSLLTSEQLNAFSTISDAIDHQKPSLFFLNGGGGTGKTFLYETLAHTYRAKRYIVLCVASTGVAALLLPKGRTAHSIFKIPVTNLTDNSVCSVSKQSQLAALLRLTRLIIWDECVMSHRWVIESVNRTLQDVCDSNEIMGGIVSVLGGDWNQCLPIVEQGSREDVIAACLQRSVLWDNVEILHLTVNIRAHDLLPSSDFDFAEWLQQIGNGAKNDDESTVVLPPTMTTISQQTLLLHVYEDIYQTSIIPPPSYFLSRSILAPQNITVDDINDELLTCFPGESVVYASADSITTDNSSTPEETHIAPEDLSSYNIPNFPPATLCVKIGCPLILLRNLNPSQGLCNGTRMVLLRATDRVLEVLILTGDHANEKAFIPRVILHPQSASLPFNFSRRQFPVRLSFAMTINKSEGQTFDTIGIDLRAPVFSHGQLYVALSRTRTSTGIKVLLPPSSYPTNRTLNVVYPEIVLRV